MDDVLEPYELAQVLEKGFAQAAAVDMPFLHVEVAVPFRCAYRWRDPAGTLHAVHMPTKAFAHPVEFPYAQVTDSGPAARFMLAGGAQPQSFEQCLHLAGELYPAAISWGYIQYGDAMPSGVEHLPELPVVFEDAVARGYGVNVDS